MQDREQSKGGLGHSVGEAAHESKRDDSPEQLPEQPADPLHPNPPFTTSHKWFTAPEFGAAGSGGGEYEPGPEKD